MSDWDQFPKAEDWEQFPRAEEPPQEERLLKPTPRPPQRMGPQTWRQRLSEPIEAPEWLSSRLEAAPLTEAALALGSAPGAAITSGYMGLLGTLLPGPEGQGKQFAEQTLGDMVYRPRGAVGQGLVSLASLPGRGLAWLGKRSGEMSQELGASPGYAAMEETFVNALPYLFGASAPRVGPAASPASRFPGRIEPTLSGRVGPLGGRVEPTIGGTNVFRSNRPVPAAPSPAPATVPLQQIGNAQPIAPATSIRNPANRIRLETFEEANRAGYVFPPTHIENSWLRSRLESLGGKAATKQEAVLRNQQVTNDLARRAARLPKDIPITEAALKNQRSVDAQPYRDVAALSPQAEQWLPKLQQARFDAKQNHRAADISGDPNAMKEARRLDNLVDYYERKIDGEAVRLGRPELLGALKEARKRIAMSHDVERALNVGTGDIDARVIGRIVDQRGVDAVSGPLLTIGKTARAFPQFVGPGAGTPTPGVSALETIASAGLGMGGAAVAGPSGALAAGIPLLRGPARTYALSHRMQAPLRAGVAGLSLRDVARGAAFPLAMTPALGLRVPQEE